MSNPRMWVGAGAACGGAAWAAGLEPTVAVVVGAAVSVVGAVVTQMGAPVKVAEPQRKPKKERKVKGTQGRPLPQEEAPKPKPKKKKAKKVVKEVEVVEDSSEDEPPPAPKPVAAPVVPLTKNQKKKAAQKKKAEEKEVEIEEPSKKKKKKKAAAAAPAPVPVVEEAIPEPEKKKKKKKKKVVVSSEDEEEEEEEGWEVQKVKGRKPKAKGLDEVVGEGTSRAAEHVMEVRINSKFYGKIIGDQGATRQALTDATGATIDIPKKGGIRDYITLTGSKAGCVECEKAILDLVSKGYTNVLDKDTTDDGIEVESKHHGTIIGPGGSHIKAIAAKTGAKINMPDRDSDSNRISVVGDNAAVAQALAAIRDLIATGISSLTHENFVKSSLTIPQAQIATLIGSGGATIKDLQTRTSTKVNISDDRSSGFINIDIVGESAGVNAARTLIASLMAPPASVPVPQEWTQAATLSMVNVW